VHQPVLVSIPAKTQLIATSSCLKAPRVPHRNDLTMSGHLVTARALQAWQRTVAPVAPVVLTPPFRDDLARATTAWVSSPPAGSSDLRWTATRRHRTLRAVP